MRSAEENKLEKDLRRWFNKLHRKIQKLIDTYYEDELFFLHINKVYTIVEEMKPEYRAILLKHGLTQFYNARETTTTLYTIQQKKVSTKAGLYEPQFIREEDVGLFRTNPQIEDSLRYNTFQASDTTLARVTQNITNNLADSYHEGLGIRDAGRKITKEFSSLKGWETRRIARTEINSAQNEGAFSAYDDLGVEYQMWWTGKDNRVRDSHRPLHGHIVAVGNTFSNGLLYPGDKSGPIKEWINCRCTSIPYIIPLGKMAPPGLTEFTEDQLIDIPGYTPITVEDALNGENNFNDLLQSVTSKTKIQDGFPKQSRDYGIPINLDLRDNSFRVPTLSSEELNDLGMIEGDLGIIQSFGKRRMGSQIEYGFSFKKGKITTYEAVGDKHEINIPIGGKNYHSIHYHTNEGFNAPSHGDISDFLKTSKQKTEIVLSDNETWFIQADRSKIINITQIEKKVKKLEEKRLDIMKKEYHKELKRIRLISNPKERRKAQENFDKYLANSFLDKHNKKLGNEIENYLSSIKGLKVKRVQNVKFNRGDITKKLKFKPKPKNGMAAYGHRRSTASNVNEFELDKYALTEAENKQYEKLKKIGEENLKFMDKRAFRELRDRKRLNEMHNTILLKGEDAVNMGLYDNLMKQFKDWVPKGKIEIKPIEINKKEVFKKDESFKLNSREKTVFKELKTNTGSLNEKERKYLFELRDKNSLNILHKKLINRGLDDLDSKNYVELYSKYKEKWDLPDLDINLKFTTKKKYYSREQTYKQAKEFKLTKKENEELYKLEKKELLGQKLSSQELKRKELLQAQDEFAYLNALNKKHGGLNYEDYSKFKKLYKQVKTNIKIDKRILEQPLSNYKSDIPLDKNPKNLKKFKGTNDEGLLPNGEEITDYFTKDARDMTIREQQVAHRWLGSDYKAFTNFEVDCGRDVKKFEKWIYDMAKAYEKDNSLKYYEYYYKNCRNNITGKLNKSLAKDLARSIAHDVPVLDDILNNQLKQGITLWRVQENHNLTSIVVGDIMDFPNFRSAAISKEGALWFSATNSKPMKYLIEIEAPTGTRGAFLAPIKQGTWFAPPEIGVAHPLHGQNYAREMEFLLKECKVELVKFGGKPVKGAMGEDLIPIKLRVVGYK